jgi:hypothetical protein|tara:strand:+ start:1976 stop:2275 length:300 start_codon:yes stop_codon:yes gene_type:complete
MKIKADKDLYITTTWGAAIFLKAGEVREVGDDLGYQALAQGAVEDKEVVVAPKPVKKTAKKKVTKKVRARTKTGHYKADDPNTPDVNEAFIEVDVANKE